MVRLLIFNDTYMPLIALLVYARLWKDIKRKELSILMYLLFNFILFGISNIMLVYKVHNMPLYHTFSIVELWILSYYILKKITGKGFSKVFWIINILYAIFFTMNILFLESISLFNSNSAGLSSLIILFLCMYYLLALSRTDEILNFQALPSFWIISGFLIYNAVSVLVLLSYKYFTYINLPKDGDNLWFVLSAANIIKFALIITGLLCHKKRPATHLPFLL